MVAADSSPPFPLALASETLNDLSGLRSPLPSSLSPLLPFDLSSDPINPSGSPFCLNPSGRFVFAHVVQGPEDHILRVTVACNKDPSPNKVNLGVGAYRTEEGKPLVLDVVQKLFMS